MRAMIRGILYDASSFVSTEVHERERGEADVKVKRPMSQSMEGQEGDIAAVCIYFCLYR